MRKILSVIGLITSLFLGQAFAQGEAPADAKFLDQFSEHHQEAIKMAEMAEDKAQSQELKKIAEKMVKDQKKEVQQMQTWRQRFYPNAPKSPMEMPKMDMSKLEKAQGHEFDMVFAEMMSKHHDQGIQMVESVSDELSNPQVKKFAQQSAKNQEKDKQKLAKMKSDHSAQR